jgi:signal transduction histidine kinase
MDRSRSLAFRYITAIVAIAAVLTIGSALAPILGHSFPYITLFPAIAFAAWHCGTGPSIVGSLLGLFVAQVLFVRPAGAPLWTVQEWTGIAGFVLASGIIIVMGETRRRENEALKIARGELEQQVKDRTAELDSANSGLRDLTARLMKLQDEERRRIARELHDSVGQSLAALGMNLTSIESEIERLTKTAATLRDSATLVREMNQEIRTISHLLHPPLLDEAGLASALRWYAEGFAERSKIQVVLEIPKDFERLNPELETAVFRFVQECLTNVHKHSQGQRAKIQIVRVKDAIQVAVEDDGQGISLEKKKTLDLNSSPGVGIRGMRERLRQLGGSIEFQSAGGIGTIVCANLPLAGPVPVKQAGPLGQAEALQQTEAERPAPIQPVRADSANAADAA